MIVEPLVILRYLFNIGPRPAPINPVKANTTRRPVEELAVLGNTNQISPIATRLMISPAPCPSPAAIEIAAVTALKANVMPRSM